MSDIKYSWYHSSKGYKIVGGNSNQLLRADGGVEDKTDYSKKSANESWDGAKTFTLAPIVPTPTLNTHAVNKIYVDGNFIPNSQKNQPNGVATLGSDGKHTPSQYGVQATHEAYQNWGGQHVVGASPIDAVLNNRINANRFAFFPANKMVIENFQRNPSNIHQTIS